MLVSHVARSWVYRFGLSVIFSVGAALAPATAGPISLSNATGEWQNAALAPASGGWLQSTLILTDGPGNGPDVAQWGEDYENSFNASSYTFLTTPDNAGIEVGTPFLLGTFSHYNNGISTNGITGIDYSLSFDILGGLPLPLTALIHFAHNETLNAAVLCPEDASNPCDDVVTTSLPGQTSFLLNGNQTLYLHLLGFSQDGGLTYGSQFFSPEGGTNTAMLYGLVSSDPAPIPNPEPATVVLLGTGLALAVYAGRRRARGATDATRR